MYNKASSHEPSGKQHPSHTQKEHHVDLLKAVVGSRIVSAVSKVVGVGGGGQKRVIMSFVEEHIVTTAAAAKAVLLRPKDGFTERTLSHWSPETPQVT